jgi:hypothetical protein
MALWMGLSVAWGVNQEIILGQEGNGLFDRFSKADGFSRDSVRGLTVISFWKRALVTADLDHSRSHYPLLGLA